MSHAGKVLHLYVEVRSVAEEEGKVPGSGDDGTSHLILQCPDVLPHSQRSSVHSSPNRSPDLSPVTQHQTLGGSHSLPPSQSSSRQSVNFQFQHPDALDSSNQFQQLEMLHDGFNELLQILAPGNTNPGHRGSTDMDPHHRTVVIAPSTPPGKLTVPSTPTGNLRSYEAQGLVGQEGHTSVVTFGYVEKSNVHNMGSRRNSVFQSEYENCLDRREVQPLRLRKRLSEPEGYNDEPGQGEPYQPHFYPSLNRSPQSSASLQRDAAARDAIYRASEEFASPQLRYQFAGHGSPTLSRHYRTPHCRSWAGSPILPRSTLTLPLNTQLLELDRGLCRSSVNGLPRSPASDQLCAHTGYPTHSAPPSTPALNQRRPWLGDQSPRLCSKFHPPLPAGRPTDIQHEIPKCIFSTSNQSASGYQASGNNPHSVSSSCNTNISNINHNAANRTHYSANNNSCRTHYKLPPCSRRPSDVISPASGRRSVSPSSNAEVACKLAVEASFNFAERRTPSPPSQAESLRSESPKIRGAFPRESQPYATSQGQISPEPLSVRTQNRRRVDKPIPQTRPGHVSPVLHQKGVSSSGTPALPATMQRAATSQSPILDPWQQQSSSPSKDTSSLHRYQPPQYKEDHKSPSMERRQCAQLFDKSSSDSPELSRKNNSEALPISWTSRHQEWRQDSPLQGRTELCEEPYTLSVYTGEDKGVQTSAQERQRSVGGLFKNQREEVFDLCTVGGTSSHSSSGVTGSLGDKTDRPSPETSSQSSHDTADTGCGIQVCRAGGGVCVRPLPNMHPDSKTKSKCLLSLS